MTKLPRGVAASLLVAVYWLVAPQASAQIIVKLGTVAPEQSIWHDALLRIRQSWREISAGEIELRIYAGGVLGGEDEMIRKMQRRGLDAIAISGSGLPLIDGIVSCLDVPLLFESYAQLDAVRAEVAPEIEARIESRGYKVLGWAEAGWVRFFSKAPVRVPDDLRQQRLWISTGAPEHEELLVQLGFRVVPLPVTDMLTGLQTGLIEAIDVPPLFALVNRSFQEASFMTALDFSPLNSAVVISLAVWDRIPEIYHSRLRAAVRDAIEELRAGIQAAELAAIDEMLARGLMIVDLESSEEQQWKSLVRSVYDDLYCNRQYPELFERIVRSQQRVASEAAR